MEIIKTPRKIDFSDWNKNPVGAPDFGLPRDVQFCQKCVLSNQRPNSAPEFLHRPGAPKVGIRLDDSGVCAACNFAEKKQSEVDWDSRKVELEILCDRFRRNDGSYDCVVPGSGGKDSVLAAHVLKFEYGMHPLTVTWAPHIYTDWGWKNFESWIHSGQDNLLMTPNGRVHRLLTRLATETLLHPFQPFVLGQKALAPKLAVLHQIPLVFYGENEAEYGNPVSANNGRERDSGIYTESGPFEDSFLGGVRVRDLIEHFGLSRSDLLPYEPLSLTPTGPEPPQVHYLGYYLKWHPQAAFYSAVGDSNFEPAPERSAGTFSRYSSIDDRIDDIHYYTKGAKYGLGRASYDAAQEIRSGDIDRDEAILLVQKFDHEFPERFIDEILEYLSIPADQFPVASKMFEQPVMDREYFDRLVDSFRPPHLWRWENGWKLRKPIWEA